MYQLEWTQYSKEDYYKLDGRQKIFVDKVLNRIISLGMAAGQPLSGNLLYCNNFKNRKTRLRVVFREIDGKLQIIQIVAMGKRDKNEMYKTAEQRLD
ncbi:addiction module toxin RelE [Exiguobacterium sp. A1_3_1]|uniref:type II toxin-antitoxin system RelE family toxin n=1 Tax=Exiguobacterium sp. A1_3_1 TaxID=2651871 RepID=UPI003B89C6F7